MAFEDLGDYVLDGAALRFPIKGKTYVVPAPPVSVGLRAQALMSMGSAAAAAIKRGEVAAGEVTLTDRDREVLSDTAERDLWQDLLGPAYDQMLADDVPWAVLKHAAVTVMIDCTTDRATAEKYWASLGKRPAPTDRKPPARSTRSRGTAGAGSTRRPASTSGTTSRRSSARTNPAG